VKLWIAALFGLLSSMAYSQGFEEIQVMATPPAVGSTCPPNAPLIKTNAGPNAGIWQCVNGSVVKVGPARPSSVATALITDAPYNAKCNGATDDHAAIQSAINAVLTQGNGVGIVEWPPSVGNDYTQCNTGTTTLTVPPGSNLTIDFHGSIIDYAGNGHAIESICIGCFSPTGTYLYLNDMQMLLTGTPSNGATGVYVDGTVLTMYNWGIGGGQAGAHAVQLVDFSQFISELGSSDALFFTQSSQVHALNDYYFPPTNGTVPANTAAWTIDAPDGATTFVNTTFLWDNSDGATTGNVNVELLDSLAGGNGDQAVWFINTLMHVSDSFSEFILKFDASATEAVFGQFALWDSGYPGGVWTGKFHGDLLVTNGTLTAHLVNGVTVSGLPYSAAGVPIPTCNAGLVNLTAQVSDATTPTFLGTYVSGGAVKAPVFCNGTNWVTY
jgi:hypothetical protein